MGLPNFNTTLLAKHTGEFIKGAKGSESPRAPVEAPDSLHSTAYANILDAITEGPIKEQPKVYYDDTPLKNGDGSLNFQNVSTDWRPGTQDQSHIAGFPSVENEHSLNLQIKQAVPIIQTVSGADLSAVRLTLSTPSLYRVNTTNGDTSGATIMMGVDIATDGGAYTTIQTVVFSGKTTNTYERSVRIELPKPGSVWQIRVRRITADSSSSSLVNDSYFASLTEIIDAKLRYPNTALYATKIDASQFSNVPTRKFFGKWRIIKIPSNYDPLTRNYSGIWDGTFKNDWTNNPAWVFYDMITNDRFGLGHRIVEANVDRYRLYNIARYCDEMVDDGLGGLEPRFTFNMQFQSQADAYKVLQDLAACFRGITYYMSGVFVANADAPQDPIYTYTQANVVDGRFVYSGTGRQARHTVALVSWNDNDDFGKSKVEPVIYRPGVARYGINQTSVTALGCTSRGQAQRVGNHILISENLETEVVNFSVGLEGVRCMPGEVFAVADANRAGRRMGGRIHSHAGRVVTVDQVPEGLSPGDTLVITLPNGTAEGRTIQNIAGKAITVALDYSALALPQSVFAARSDELALQLFRMISIEEKDDNTYEISGLKYVPEKYAYIDDGTKIELPPITIIPPSVQPPPTNVVITNNSVIEQEIATNVATITWDKADSAIKYHVEWQRDDLPWVKITDVPTTSVEIRNVYAGNYLVRVYAIGPTGVISMPALSALTPLQGKTTPPPALTSLTTQSIVFGITLKWGFPLDATDTSRTEIWYSASNDRSAAIKLGDFSYPQNSHTLMGLAAGVTFFFWGRLVDKSGNIGAWYPAGVNAGVVGQSSSDADDILDYLTGEITKSQLGQELLHAVDLVDPMMAGENLAFAGDDTVWAGVWTYVDAQQDGDTALATRIDTVAAQNTNTAALVQTETTARVSADGALASQITTVQATADGAAAGVTTNATAIANTNGKLAATYTIKAQVASNGRIYAAGLGLGVEQQPDGSYQSQFIMLADRVAVLSIAGGVEYSPFAITGGQVFINSAFIQDGTITNAKIGNTIQSTATGAGGNPRWKLDKAGTLTMTGANAGSGYLTVTDSVINVYDGAGTLRVRMGLW